MIFVLNKIDLIGKEDVEKIKSWEEYPDLLYDEFENERGEIMKDYFLNVINAFKQSDIINKVSPVSSKDMFGFDDIYSDMANYFLGGEDTDTGYKDE